MNSRTKLVIALLGFGLAGCEQAANFVQRSMVKGNPPSTQGGGVVVTSYAPPTAIPTPTASATPDTRTTIEILTPSIVNNAANQILKVKVSYQGASGNPLDFPFNRVLFDMASTNFGTISSTPYEVKVSNALTYAGLLDPVWGADLFGNMGSNYFHNETDQKIDIPAGVTWFTFSIDLSFTVNHPYGSGADNPPAQESIPIYLKFGDDSMVATANVLFLNR